MFPGPLPVWGESWEVLFSQDAPRRLLVPSPVSTFQGVPAPPLQIPHQEVQVRGADSPSSALLLEGHVAAMPHQQRNSLVFLDGKSCNDAPKPDGFVILVSVAALCSFVATAASRTFSVQYLCVFVGQV